MKTFLLFLKRLFGIAEASTNAMIAKSDKKVNIEEHANLLLAKQNEQRDNIIKSRNSLIEQQKILELDYQKKDKRLKDIKSVIIASSKQDKDLLTTNQIQGIKTAAHEGPLIVQSLALISSNLEYINTSIDNVVINVGIIDRNIMTIKHQLEMLKTRDVIANVKSKVYTVVDADSYFNLAKLEEIVDSKEASSNAKEAIFNLDHNTTGQLQEDTLSADAFMKDVLGQTGDVISKQITSYTYNGTGLETAR